MGVSPSTDSTESRGPSVGQQGQEPLGRCLSAVGVRIPERRLREFQQPTVT